MNTIYKRELSAFFRSPVAYTVIGMFMVMAGLFFWIYNVLSGSVYFGDTLNSISLFLIFFSPIPVSYTHLDVYKRQDRAKKRNCRTHPQFRLIQCFQWCRLSE